MITLKDAMGGIARPFARTLSTWHLGPAWRARAVRVVYPDLARALDDLSAATEARIGKL